MTSDRVHKLVDLTNGNQRVVVQAQKQRGMQVFQVREGDTKQMKPLPLRQTTTRQSNIPHHLPPCCISFVGLFEPPPFLHQRVALFIRFVLLPLHGIAGRFRTGRHGWWSLHT